MATSAIDNEPILIVEDNPDDAFLLKRALQKNQVRNPIQVVENGLQAIQYLCAEPPFDDRKVYPFPTVIYTDLKMPLKDGFEVLEWLKKHPRCAVIPVIVLTASNQDADIKRAYELGANSYMVKPGSFDDLTELIALALAYWKACLKPSIPPKC
jgi:CheY-like chemotaxis protein